MRTCFGKEPEMMMYSRAIYLWSSVFLLLLLACIFFLLKKTNVHQCRLSVTSMVDLKVYMPRLHVLICSAGQDWLKWLPCFCWLRFHFVACYVLIGIYEHLFKRTVGALLSCLDLIQKGIVWGGLLSRFLVHIHIDVSFYVLFGDIIWSLQGEIA